MEFDPINTPLTLDMLQQALSLELNFTALDWGDVSNELMVTLKFGDTQLCTSHVYIDPAGYKREDD